MDDYIKSVSLAFQMKKSEDIAILVSLTKQNERLEEHLTSLDTREIASISRELQASNNLRKIVLLFLNVVKSFLAGNYKLSNKLHTDLLTYVMGVMRKGKEIWMADIVKSLCKDAYLISVCADTASKEWRKVHCISGSNRHLEDMANRVHSNCFSQLLIMHDPAWQASAIYAANYLLRMYSRVNNSDQYGNVVTKLCAILRKDNKVEEKCPLPELVTFYYFAGKYYYADSKYHLASNYFTFAYTNCPCTSVSNKRKVLHYLVLSHLCLGFLPSLAILEKAQLAQLQPIVASIRNGNVALFNKTVSENQVLFVRCNCFFQVMKLKMLVYRRLFKSVYLWHNHKTVPIMLFYQALFVCGESVEKGVSAESLLEMLIAEGYIKGYIAHSHGMVVFSKETAFIKLPLKKFGE